MGLTPNAAAPIEQKCSPRMWGGPCDTTNLFAALLCSLRSRWSQLPAREPGPQMHELGHVFGTGTRGWSVGAVHSRTPSGWRMTMVSPVEPRAPRVGVARPEGFEPPTVGLEVQAAC